MEQTAKPKNATVEYNEIRDSGAHLIKSFDQLAASGSGDAAKQDAMSRALEQYRATLKSIVITPEGAHINTIENCVKETSIDLLLRAQTIQNASEKTSDKSSHENLKKLYKIADEATKEIKDCLLISAYEGGYILMQTEKGIAISPRDLKAETAEEIHK